MLHIRIALAGLGTTGNLVAEFLHKQRVLSFVLCRSGSPNEGKDLGEVLERPFIGIPVISTDNLAEKLEQHKPDIVIDFSGPAFLKKHLATLAKGGVNVVTAVTGYSRMDVKRIRVLTRKHKNGVIMAPNITFGVNVMLMMAQLAAYLQPDYDFDIVEENHRHKKDSPSGTAEKIAAALTDVFNKAGELNKRIGIHSIRAGDVAGKHKVLICGKYDQIELTHTAFSRLAFAEGAYKAAKFILNKVGFYEMKEVFRVDNGFQPKILPNQL